MKVVYSPLHRHHAPPWEVESGAQVPMVESPERAESIRAPLESDGSFPFVVADLHGLEPITALHHPAMVRYLQGAWAEWAVAEPGCPAIVPDTLLHAGLVEGMTGALLPSGAPDPRSPGFRPGRVARGRHVRAGSDLHLRPGAWRLSPGRSVGGAEGRPPGEPR